VKVGRSRPPVAVPLRAVVASASPFEAADNSNAPLLDVERPAATIVAAGGLVQPVPRLALSVEEACGALGVGRDFWHEHIVPELRKQLANLRPGGPPGAGFRPGQPSPVPRHGLHTIRPGAVLLGDVAREVVDALAATVPLRGADGDVDLRFVPAVEAAALQLLIVRRVQSP
jgi:hypothetical protein